MRSSVAGQSLCFAPDSTALAKLETALPAVANARAVRAGTVERLDRACIWVLPITLCIRLGIDTIA